MFDANKPSSTPVPATRAFLPYPATANDYIMSERTKGVLMTLPSKVVIWAGTGAWVGAAIAQTSTASKPPLAEDVFKNIQVLKGIPVDEFMGTMGMIAASTGMNCVNCHASDNTTSWDKFADDTPLKETARKMLLMVNT